MVHYRVEDKTLSRSRGGRVSTKGENLYQDYTILPHAQEPLGALNFESNDHGRVAGQVPRSWGLIFKSQCLSRTWRGVLPRLDFPIPHQLLVGESNKAERNGLIHCLSEMAMPSMGTVQMPQLMVVEAVKAVAQVHPRMARMALEMLERIHEVVEPQWVPILH